MDKVIVGMSGGIDSSVAALLLKKQGYEVIGVTLKHLGDDESEDSNTKTCCSLDDIYDAKRACQKIGINHYVIDAIDEFKEAVIDYFVASYNKGITPSPCVICDEKIKIKKLVEFADRVGAEFIATGHYSKVEFCQKFGKQLLANCEDSRKDQTYMLYRLPENTLKRMLFPLENLRKTDVREIAKESGIETFDKKDSQGICFAPEGYIDFLKRVLGDEVKEGNFISRDHEILGKHKGYQLYTIGQRRGLELKLPRAYFVIDINPETNEVILGDFENLLIDRVELINYKFIPRIEELVDKTLIAKARFSSSGLEGKLEEIEGKLYFVYKDRNSENSPGQHMVIYFEGKVVGGGEIKFIKKKF